MDPFPILIIGCVDRPEFRGVAAWLSEYSAIFADDFTHALKLLNDGEISPALIVLLEFAPPRISNDQLHTLRQAAPLAKIVRLLGPWFEGEIRTGQPLAATLRVYWHQWRANLQNTLERSQESGFLNFSSANGRLSLPMTAGDDDRLLRVSHDLICPDLPVRLIAVVARERETAQSLCDLCSQRNWKAVWFHTPPAETPLKVDAIIFDSISGAAKESAMGELTAIAGLKAVSKDAPLVVLCGFLRRDDVPRWQSAGAAVVISKPFLAEDLLWQIEQLLPQPATTAV
jgi:CheY-like chemotaxis protein